MMLLMWKASSSPMAVSWLDNKPLHLGWRFWNMTLSPWFLLIRMAPITKKWGKQTTCYLLMIRKSGVHQLRLVGYPIIYRGFIRCRWIAGYLNQTPLSTRWIEVLYQARAKRRPNENRYNRCPWTKNMDIEQRSISLPGSPWKWSQGSRL